MAGSSNAALDTTPLNTSARSCNLPTVHKFSKFSTEWLFRVKYPRALTFEKNFLGPARQTRYYHSTDVFLYQALEALGGDEALTGHRVAVIGSLEPWSSLATH